MPAATDAAAQGAAALEAVLDWCAAVLGPVELAADDLREHPGLRASALRLRSRHGDCFVKLHRDPAHWHSEAHAYEHWAPAFGPHAPRLLGVREEEPLAILVSALPGIPMEQVRLSAAQEQVAWRAAGQALAGLHACAEGAWFGLCRRDGSPAEEAISDPPAHVAADFDHWLEPGLRAGWLSAGEQAVVRAALALLPVFAGERPLPCHRDYGPANWLVSQSGEWAGVIDFEFSGWDVRAAEFTRYPDWDWIEHPQRVAALYEGYGRSFSPAEEQQLLVGHALYALAAVVWGMQNDYFGFAAEGRRALAYLTGKSPFHASQTGPKFA